MHFQVKLRFSKPNISVIARKPKPNFGPCKGCSPKIRVVRPLKPNISVIPCATPSTEQEIIYPAAAFRLEDADADVILDVEPLDQYMGMDQAMDVELNEVLENDAYNSPEDRRSLQWIAKYAENTSVGHRRFG